ncbi:MAG: hypothetical protein ACLU9S_03840 [Oscillospiraceae bacterium]
MEAIYPEVEVLLLMALSPTTEGWNGDPLVINPNQDGVYQQKLDEALLNQASAAN